MGGKRADERRIKEMRVEVGVKEKAKNKLARSRLTWAGHVDKKGDEWLAKRADAQKVERKRGEEEQNCNGGLQ